MLILESADLKLVFIHVPKAAGTSLRHLLLEGIKKRYPGIDVEEVKSVSDKNQVKRVHSHRDMVQATSPFPYLHSSSEDKENKIKSSQSLCNIAGTLQKSSSTDNINTTTHKSKSALSTREHSSKEYPNKEYPRIDEDVSTSSETRSILRLDLLRIHDIVRPMPPMPPKTTCYGYWHIHRGVDLAHVPRSHFQSFYPPDRAYRVNKRDFRWITSVRNPYSRIYSAYCWYMRENFMKVDCVEFNRFVIERLPLIIANYHKQFEAKEVPSCRHIHFMPMWMMLAPEPGVATPQFDYVIRQENFANDVRELLKELNLPYTGKDVRHHHSRGKGTGNYDHIQHYTIESLQVIECLYARDFLLF